MSEENNIHDDQLDELLKAHALNEGSKKENAALAKAVLDQEYGVKMSKAKEKELLSKLSGSSASGGFKLWFLVLLVPVLCAVAYFIFSPREDTNISQVNDAIPEQVEEKVVEASVLEEVQKVLPGEINDYFEVIPVAVDSASGEEKTNPKNPSEAAPEAPEEAIQPEPVFPDYLAPYARFKVDIIEQLLDMHKEIYSRVPAGHIVYQKQKYGVDAFIIRNFSVTNMEYKAFLADLMLTSNEKGYKEAKIKTEVWKDFACSQLASAYFTDKAYDGFPVVNLSAKAMLMYCRWLEEETNAYLKLKDPKAKAITLRLPYDYEWISAAKIGKAQIPVCKGYQTIFDLTEGLVNKGFIKRIEKIQNSDHHKKSAYDVHWERNRYGWTEAAMLEVFQLGRAKSLTPYPTNLQDIGKIAHVSECILNKEGKLIVFGSCWETKEEYTEMLNQFQHKNASPFVGFRYIVVDETTETYKNPFW